MKKKNFLGLLMVLPFTLLCACGSSPLTLGANWHEDPAMESITGTDETLTYDVAFTASSDMGLVPQYELGSYTTHLYSELYTFENDVTETVYVYETRLDIAGVFQLGTEVSERFEDYVTSKVAFRNVKKQFAPIYSTKTVYNHVPTSMSPDSLENGVSLQNFTYECKYDLALTTLETTFTDLMKDTPAPVQKTYALGEKYFDNEQILLVLRGMTLANGVSFNSFNNVKNQVATVNGVFSSNETVSIPKLDLNGENKTELNVSCSRITLSYTGNNTGAPQTIWLANHTTPNTYRNVITMMDVPMTWGIGTFRYSLVGASFTD